MHTASLTLKSVSSTRWESKIDAIKPLRYQLGQTYDALCEIQLDEGRDSDTRCKSKSLANKIFQIYLPPFSLKIVFSGSFEKNNIFYLPDPASNLLSS